MVRDLRRLLIAPARLDPAGVLQLEPSEVHYLVRVLRLRRGDRFAVVDGCGHLWSAELQEAGRARLEQPVAVPLEQGDCPMPQLELLLAWPKRDGELLLRMACELGIDRVCLVAAERGQAGVPRGERLRTILREATEQCERLWLPQLDGPLQPAQAFAPLGGAEVGLLATTRRTALRPLPELLATTPAARLRLAIGPEGGWTPSEEELAFERGWLPVSLGHTILRTATAAVAGAAQLTAWRAARSLEA